MRKWFRIAIVFVLWIVNLFVGTGLDAAYHVTQYTRWAVMFVTAVLLLVRSSQTHSLSVVRRQFYIFAGMAALFIASSSIHGYGTQAIRYLWVFLLIYLLSKLKFTEKDFVWIGLSYGIAGFAVVFLFSQGRVFDGWNENSIAMIGMFSFMVMLIPLYKERSRRSKLLIIALTFAFAYYLNPTNSRSSILFMVVGVMLALSFLKRDYITRKGNRLIFLLVLPLFVALFTILISKGSYMSALDAWSYSRFRKPIFNGRDEIWARGLRLLLGHFFIGTGSNAMANWHNSAISVLVAYGVLGYVFWLASFGSILSRAYPYISDYIVQGCFIGFIIIYFQQSLELGLVSSNPSLIPYVMLGLMLGRIRYLKDRTGDHDEAERNRTSL